MGWRPHRLPAKSHLPRVHAGHRQDRRPGMVATPPPDSPPSPQSPLPNSTTTNNDSATPDSDAVLLMGHKRKRARSIRRGRPAPGSTGEAFRCAQASRLGQDSAWRPKYTDASIAVLQRVVDGSAVVKAFDRQEYKLMAAALAYSLPGVGKQSGLKLAVSAMNRVYERAVRISRHTDTQSAPPAPPPLLQLHSLDDACAWLPARDACSGIHCCDLGRELLRKAAAELKVELGSRGFVKCV